jgi:hypothetical protein
MSKAKDPNSINQDENTQKPIDPTPKSSETSKSVMLRNKVSTGIQTQAGIELFTYMNQNYGSAVWGKVLNGILAIEAELK